MLTLNDQVIESFISILGGDYVLVQSAALDHGQFEHEISGDLVEAAGGWWRWCRRRYGRRRRRLDGFASREKLLERGLHHVADPGSRVLFDVGVQAGFELVGKRDGDFGHGFLQVVSYELLRVRSKNLDVRPKGSSHSENLREGLIDVIRGK